MSFNPRVIFDSGKLRVVWVSHDAYQVEEQEADPFGGARWRMMRLLRKEHSKYSQDEHLFSTLISIFEEMSK